MKRTLAIFLALALLLSTMVVYARGSLADIDMEDRHYVDVLIEAQERGFIRNNSIQGAGSAEARREAHEAFRVRLVEHFMPNYVGLIQTSHIHG